MLRQHQDIVHRGLKFPCAECSEILSSPQTLRLVSFSSLIFRARVFENIVHHSNPEVGILTFLCHTQFTRIHFLLYEAKRSSISKYVTRL